MRDCARGIVDYTRLVLAFTFLFIESLLRLCIWLFPPLRLSKDFFNAFWPKNLSDSPTSAKGDIHTSESFIRSALFPFEPHYAKTLDGYVLALHRISSSRKVFATELSSEAQLDKDRKVSRRLSLVFRQKRGGRLNTPKPDKPVVLLWHGFLMSSEVWVCQPILEQNLAFVLAEAQVIIILHMTLKPTQEEFWDFSLDSLAFYDLPDTVDYILKCTGAPSLTYIGFSQGTAQGFSALSMNPSLNKKINLFIALAPVTKPRGMYSASPEVIYLLFGRKVMLSSVLFWESVLSSWTFAKIIDFCVWMLFGWTSKFVSHKNVVYRHLYSFTSVKIVVHWFQIMRTRRFQMYEESPTFFRDAVGGHIVPKFPTEHIKTPIALFYGGKDTLPDVKYIFQNSPAPVFCLKVEEQEFEHVDFLWGKELNQLIFPGIIGLLHEYAEMWPDLQMNNEESESQNSSSTSFLEDEVIRMVPWISKQSIQNVMCRGLGNLHERRHLLNEGYGKISILDILNDSSRLTAQESRKEIGFLDRIFGSWRKLSDENDESKVTRNDEISSDDETPQFEIKENNGGLRDSLFSVDNYFKDQFLFDDISDTSEN
ncbi:cholesterol esterase [Nowakowskiella sp. JEL0078]|nr:cholesterol esterase [Nowakowskiella sp. JEL0078]